MITVAMVGDREVLAWLNAMPQGLRNALRRRIAILQLELQAKVRSEHLSGPTGEHTLSVGQSTSTHTGGQLRRSVTVRPIEETATSIEGAVGYAGDVAYAAIHEFGGTISIPDIYPKNAKALHFWLNGEEVFAKHVRAHQVHIPKRAPLLTAFQEMRPIIESSLLEAASQGIRSS